MSKIVKIGKMPGTLQDLALNDNATVADALSQAGISSTTGFEIRMNGSVVTPETAVANNAIILLVAKIKGNCAITVKVGKMPGTLQTLAVEAGTTVAEILTMAGFTSIAGFEVRLSGAVVSGSSLVTEDNAIILLVAKIKGN